MGAAPQKERVWEDREAVPGKRPLLIGIAGPSGTGKTYSALRLATGIQKERGGEIWMIDTEAGRGLHYAEWFRYRYLPFEAPYPSSAYTSAVKHCVSKGARTIIIDSMSHEHESVGGVLEMHDSEKKRLAAEWKTTEKAADMAAWGLPKKLRAQMTFELTHLPIDVSLIFCFRAKKKIKLPPKGSGSKEPIDLGYTAIAGEELLFEMTASCLLLPGADGYPEWEPDFPGERSAVKIPRQFRGILDGQLSEEMGQLMARWAEGGASPNTAPPPVIAPPKGDPKITAELLDALRAVTSRDELEAVREQLSAGRAKRVFSSAEMRVLVDAVKTCEARLNAPAVAEAEAQSLEQDAEIAAREAAEARAKADELAAAAPMREPGDDEDA